jgi:hypothetical protein
VGRVSSAEVPAQLHEHYYLHNFLSLCASVEKQYDDFLSDQECDFLRCFYALDRAAQCLYVRLISRVGPWFRLHKLNYPEIGELAKPMQRLVKEGLVVEASGLCVDELGRLFTRQELHRAYGTLLSGPRSTSKAGLIESIEQLPMDEMQHLKQVTETVGDELRAPVCVDRVELLQLLFFGNRHQGLTDFVLSDLGLARHYPYPLNPQHRLFSCRQALEEYLACCELQDVFYQCLEVDDEEGMDGVAMLMLESETCFAVNQHRWQRAWNTVARELERRGKLELAVQLYQRSDRHPARERRARILEGLENWRGVVALCEDILAAPWCEAEQEAATKILARAKRKLGAGPKRRAPDKFQEITIVLTRSGERVERDAQLHFQGQWHTAHYVENSLMNTLFGLAFWEQIFADVPGAFYNAYQGVPKDMYESGFAARRAQGITRRLDELRSADLHDVLMDAYKRYEGYQCHWTDWRTVDENLLSTALTIIPARDLFAIWERLLFDPAENRSGFPDLIAFGEQAGEYSMIEVKGPGDALQNNQKRWLRYFTEHAIPTAVAWVEWKKEPDDG